MIDVRKAEKLWSEGVPSAQIGSAVGCAPSYVRVLARRHFWPNRAPRKDAKSLLKTVKPGTETKSKR
jgi:uncharacterized protein YjcR